MKRTLIGFLVAGLVLAGAMWLRTHYFSEEARIRRVLRGLLADLNFPAGTGNVARALKLNGVMDRFTADVTVNVEDIVPGAPPLTGRDELHSAVLAAFRQLSSCAVTIHDVAVRPLTDGSENARAAFTISVATTTPVLELPGQEFELELQKGAEGRWLIRRVAVVRTLRR